MKYLKKFNESDDLIGSPSSRESIQVMLNSFGIPTDRFRINSDGSVDVLGNVRIMRDLEKIPFKFGNIDGQLEIITKYIKDWSFMPETALKYKISKGIIENNFWKKYYEIVIWEIDRYEDFSKKGYNSNQDKILSDYYLEMAANNGLLNQYSEETDKLIWEDAKGEFFSQSNLSIEDYPFFAQFEDINFSDVLKSAKSLEEGWTQSCYLLVGVILNDDGFYKNKFEKVHLIDIYDQIRTIGIGKILKYNSRELTKMCDLVNMNLQKDARTIARDKSSDCYVFIARDGFKEDENGNYQKFLDIENLFKINIYDTSSYQTISMMRMRTRFNSDSKLWMVWLPKDFFDSDNNRISPNPYQLEIIDKYKEKI